MCKIQRTIQHAPIIIAFFLWAALLGSCIREGLPPCEEECRVTIKVVDAITGEDITTSGDVEEAELYIFDEQTYFLEKIGVSAEQIRQKAPISIKQESIKNLHISTWGNLKNNEKVMKTGTGNAMDNFRIILKKENEGFSLCPDDLFFGYNLINESTGKTENSIQELVISRKNARMYITVRGLPPHIQTDDYYFIIHKKNNGYDLRGLPNKTTVSIRQTGIFKDNGDFVSPEPFNLIHTTQKADDRMTVQLFRKNGLSKTQDILIASTDRDKNGQPIAPPAARTTNILINLTGDITVYVITTPWDEIFEWVEW